MGTSDGGTSDNGGFNLEYAALQRLSGTAQAGTGLPVVVSALTSYQSSAVKPLAVSAFPDAEDFNTSYTTAFNQILGSAPGSSFQTLVAHVTALDQVANWTISSYSSAQALEDAGAGVLQAQINAALTNPTLPGQQPTGQQPTGQQPAGQQPTGGPQ